jgi:TorA maturation chaperone TorD
VSELLRALAAFAAAPDPGLVSVAAALELPVPSAADHHQLFGGELHPYASVYLGPEGMLGGEARDRVAGFWRALGEVPPAEPDHLATLLGALAVLGDDPAPAASTARSALLWEHVLAWLPAWLDRALQLAPPSLAAWTCLLHDALLDEALAAGAPATLPAALRAAPGLDPEDLVPALVAPVRSGLVLTRGDLRRAAAELGLGVRQGERAFALRSLLSQDAPAVLGWLAGQADSTAGRLRRAPAAWHAVTAWWSDRAAATAGTLRGLANEAKEAVHAG